MDTLATAIQGAAGLRFAIGGQEWHGSLSEHLDGNGDAVWVGVLMVSGAWGLYRSPWKGRPA